MDAEVIDEIDALLVLERRYRLLEGVRTRIRTIPLAALKPGARLVGALIADLGPPLPLDNFEGLVARRTNDGRTALLLLSDDNFNYGIQRTLLYQFFLRE